MWEFVEKVVYINLAKRKDRREHMEKITLMFADKVSRFEAIENTTSGYLGCTQSHIEVLKLALKNNWKNVLILEDDIEFHNILDGYRTLQQLVTNDYDVIMLGGTCVHSIGNKVLSAQCASSYFVNSHYYATLIANLEEGYELLKQTNDPTRFANDQYWKHLQRRDNWLILQPCLLYQKPDYSNNENRYVDYRSAFCI
jgi:glycosyl transferase, family 25